MKPMLLLVSQRFFASNLQHRSKEEMIDAARGGRRLDGEKEGGRGDRGVVPPSYVLLPPLRCLRSFLFLLASHKVAAFDRLSDVNAQLEEEEEEETPSGNRNI